MIELFMPNNRIGHKLILLLDHKLIILLLFFDFNGFWRENDVTVLRANFHFPVMAEKVHDSDKCENIIEKARSVLKI